jgi:2-iminobutanoate/2-iminopropanoate deaminase
VGSAAGRVSARTAPSAFAKALGDDPPCMTLPYVAGLAAPQFKVEVDAWAMHG